MSNPMAVIACLLGAIAGLSLLSGWLVRRASASAAVSASAAEVSVAAEPGRLADGRSVEYAVSPQRRRALGEERVCLALAGAWLVTMGGTLVASATAPLEALSQCGVMLVVLALLLYVVRRPADRRGRRYRVDAQCLAVTDRRGTSSNALSSGRWRWRPC